MILKDTNGDLIFPGQIHGLAVVDARHTPAIYPRPVTAAFAVVAEGQTLDTLADGTAYMSETRSVLAWYADEELAQIALQTLLATYQFREDVSGGSLRERFWWHREHLPLPLSHPHALPVGLAFRGCHRGRGRDGGRLHRLR